jgi:hypothetical protein
MAAAGAWLVLLPALAAAALTDYAGYDVFAIMGQSNAQGGGLPLSTLPTDERIQALRINQTGVILAVDPLPTPSTGTTVGLGITAAQAHLPYLAPGRAILLVNVAAGGTGFANGYWAPGGNGPALAVAKLTEALALPGGCHRVMAVLWHQGEADALLNVSAATYRTALATLVSNARASWPGLSATTPWIVGRMSAQWVNLSATYAAVDAVIATVNQTVPYSAAVDTTDLTNNGGSNFIHFSADAQRTMGTRYYAAYRAVLNASQLAPPACNRCVAGALPAAGWSWGCAVLLAVWLRAKPQ